MDGRNAALLDDLRKGVTHQTVVAEALVRRCIRAANALIADGEGVVSNDARMALFWSMKDLLFYSEETDAWPVVDQRDLLKTFFSALHQAEREAQESEGE